MLDKIGPMTVTGSHSFQGRRGVARFLFVKGFFLAKCCRRESWFLSYPEICQMMDPPLEMDDRILDLTLYSWSQDVPISTVAISCHVIMLMERFTNSGELVGCPSRESPSLDWGDVRHSGMTRRTQQGALKKKSNFLPYNQLQWWLKR